MADLAWLIGYRRNGTQFVMQWFKGNDNPESFWYFDLKDQVAYDGYSDTNNDRVFDQFYAKGKWESNVNYEAWGIEVSK